jgi:DNA modification methylase
VIGSAQIIQADARHLPLADDSVDLIVTSPPYFALRSYQDGGEHYAGQLGSEPTPAEFVDALIEVTAECVRVLKPSGSLWVNLGDKYANPGPSGNTGKIMGVDNRDTYSRISSLGHGIQQKSLIGIPWRYAIRCIDDLGLILRAEVIWSKPNGLPESVTDRVRRSHEQWFHFTLQPRYFSAVDEIREQYDAPVKIRGQAPNGASPATGGIPTLHERSPLGKLPGSVWTIPTEPLQVPDHLGVDHFAAFPTEWPRRIIMGWSPAGVCVECGEGRRPVTIVEREHGWVRQTIGSGGNRNPGEAVGQTVTNRALHTVTGYACACNERAPRCQHSGHLVAQCKASDLCDCFDYDEMTHLPPTRPAVVLDPFGGTGTTALVAKALGRTGISVDLSRDYCRLAEWRVNDPQQLAKAARVPKPPHIPDTQLGFDLEGIA